MAVDFFFKSLELLVKFEVVGDSLVFRAAELVQLDYCLLAFGGPLRTEGDEILVGGITAVLGFLQLEEILDVYVVFDLVLLAARSLRRGSQVDFPWGICIVSHLE